MKVSPLLVAKEYKKVIVAFKKRPDVQNGVALGYRPGQDMNADLPFENWPKTIGQGLATTGFCVSASQALLYDNVFQMLLQARSAKAKLISIDIREQYYGKTYSNNQNIWHTAILVQDSGINLVVDITCAQFGNNFVGKDIWDFDTWEKTFRSPADKHIITGFDGQVLTSGINPSIIKNDLGIVEAMKNMTQITTITDSERKILAEFLITNLPIINKKLELGNISRIDYEYIEKINKLMENLDFIEMEKQYTILQFSNKPEALKYIENFVNNDGILNQYLVASPTIEDACKYAKINFDSFNIESLLNQCYLVFEFSKIKTYVNNFQDNVSTIIPYGIKLYFDVEKDIFNGGKLLNDPTPGIERKTNTIFIKVTN